MGFDFIVLGATGLQGRIASRELLEKGYSVVLCGRNKARVDYLLKKHKQAHFEYVDATDVDKTADVIKKSKAEIALNCVEGDWNLNVLKACIKANASCLDLGSEIPMTRQQFDLHKTLKEKKLTHITGCGSVPGIGNVMLRYAAEKMDSIHRIDVGFAWNSNIKKFVVPFSIASIIEEFTEPATNIEGGKFTKTRPMDSLKDYDDKFVGEQKSFYVRHPETYTFYRYYKNKGIKTIRFRAEFPPHSFDKINSIIELGLGSKEEVIVNGLAVKPIDVTTEALKSVKIPEGYTEKEDLWVRIEGRDNKKKKNMLMQCKVPTLKGWEDAGCNIDTGLTVSIMAQMLKNGTITERGAFAPEGIVPPEPFFKELAKRKMIVYENGKRIN